MPHVNPAHPAHTHLPPRDVVPTEAQLPSLYHAYSEDGFDDGELRHLITGRGFKHGLNIQSAMGKNSTM